MSASEKQTADDKSSGPYQLFMLALCAFALIALAVETLAPVTTSTRQILELADTGVCILFFGDFLLQLVAPRIVCNTFSGGVG